MEAADKLIAYFSMEIGLEAGMPTYSGGLGILAGDNIRAAADLKVAVIGVTLIHSERLFLSEARRRWNAKRGTCGVGD
jgi:starch phosphorylase